MRGRYVLRFRTWRSVCVIEDGCPLLRRVQWAKDLSELEGMKVHYNRVACAAGPARCPTVVSGCVNMRCRLPRVARRGVGAYWSNRPPPGCGDAPHFQRVRSGVRAGSRLVRSSLDLTTR